MRLLPEQHDKISLSGRLRDAPLATAALVREVIGTACRRFPCPGQAGQVTRIERLIEAEAWTETALALIDLELSQWQLRRIAYDGGEWHCALSRQRELPDWLDQSIEASHPDLALAILSTLVATKDVLSGRPSVPSAPRKLKPNYVPVFCDNFA
jgi:hypothetical protein